MSSLMNATTELMAAEKVPHSAYNYFPTKWVAIVMLTFYGISTLLHAGQAARYRMWWIYPTIFLCGVLELIGWSARLWSSFSPFLSTPFQIQITATIIAPTPLLAANFIIFATVVRRLGEQYSRLNPKLYTIIFTSCDFVSLIVQGAGGGIAASADDNKGSALGAHIILGGVTFQIAVIVAFAILAIEFFINYRSDKPTSRGRRYQEVAGVRRERGLLTGHILLMVAALVFSTLLLFIRAIYRTAELSDGWHGKIISNQTLFNVLDGVMVVFAMYTMNIAHPGRLLLVTKTVGDNESNNLELMQNA